MIKIIDELSMRNVFQIFEHQTIRIGDCQNGAVFEEKYFQELAQFSEQNQSIFFKIVHRGIRFSSFVGVLQVGNLTIEILPKTDNNESNFGKWQGVLLDMLRTCRLLKLETISSGALGLKRHSILDIYFELFIEEVEKLMQEGLVKSYHRKEANLPILKGRLVIPKHIRKNLNKRDRFLVDFENYDYNHLLNQIIFCGLDVLVKLNLSPMIDARLQRIIKIFPKITFLKVTANDFEKIRLHRQTERYQTALEIARLLILNFHPDIRNGKNHVLALLFDMNLLWEEFIYRQLKKLQNEGLQNEDFLVRRQVQKTFWKRRYLRPDIVLTYKGENWVLDTKWKVLKSGQPNIEDLRQIYVYSKYFSAEKGILVYPQTSSLLIDILSPFSGGDGEMKAIDCQVLFIDVIENGGLNQKVGSLILEKLSLRQF